MLAILAVPPSEIKEASWGVTTRKPMGCLGAGKKKLASGHGSHGKNDCSGRDGKHSIL
jgi:hypothetical protein